MPHPSGQFRRIERAEVDGVRKTAKRMLAEAQHDLGALRPAMDATTTQAPLDKAPALVLVAGDWHQDRRAAAVAWALARQAGAELIIQVGDFGFWPRHRDGRGFLTICSRLAHSTGIPCWFIDGNHEDHVALNAVDLEASGLRIVAPGIAHIPRGTSWDWDGQRWGAMGGAFSIDLDHRTPGVDWFAEEEITPAQTDAMIDAAISRWGRLDVLLCHEAPARAGIPYRFRLREDLAVRAERQRELLQRLVCTLAPDVVIHGHHHMAIDGRSATAATIGLNLETEPGAHVVWERHVE